MATDVLASGASPGIAAQGSPVEPPVLRTWALDVITLGLVVLIAWRLLGEDPQLSTRVPWWSLAIAFYAVEWLAVDLRRRFSHDTLSMISVPLVVGLFTLLLQCRCWQPRPLVQSDTLPAAVSRPGSACSLSLGDCCRLPLLSSSSA